MDRRFNLKLFFKNKKVIIFSLIGSLVVMISLISYIGFNEYTYRKVGISFTDKNYNLAEYYLNSISPTYKDVEKIKSLIHTVKNFDKTNPNDYNRTISMLDSYKGFSNINVNYFYNTYYHYVLQLKSTNALKQQQNKIPATSATTTNQAPNTQPTSNVQSTNSLTVYYVESGSVYHINSNCRSLASANNVISGPVPDGRRVCKICGEG